MVLEGQ